jgi:hypothetical protein
MLRNFECPESGEKCTNRRCKLTFCYERKKIEGAMARKAAEQEERAMSIRKTRWEEIRSGLRQPTIDDL